MAREGFSMIGFHGIFMEIKKNNYIVRSTWENRNHFLWLIILKNASYIRQVSTKAGDGIDNGWRQVSSSVSRESLTANENATGKMHFSKYIIHPLNRNQLQNDLAITRTFRAEF